MNMQHAPSTVSAPPRTHIETPVAAAALPCPRCQLTAKRSEETEWLTLYSCADCGWRFAKSR
jgi:predicted RNA-binding Zn-ribbon protein involved in translation (DUF1610 family)